MRSDLLEAEGEEAEMQTVEVQKVEMQRDAEVGACYPGCYYLGSPMADNG